MKKKLLRSKYRLVRELYFFFNLIVGLCILTISVLPVAALNIFGAGVNVFDWLDETFPLGLNE